MRRFTFLGTRGWDLTSWKYRAAVLLDKLPWTCWAGLVAWAEYGMPFTLRQRERTCRSGRIDSAGCYCGKMRRQPTKEA